MGDATIISMLPYPLEEKRPSLVAMRYEIPAAEENDFVVVHIADTEAMHYVGEGNVLRRTVSGEQVAGSLVNDHINASYGIKENAFPALKTLPGKHSKEFIQKNFAKELEELRKIQKNWFAEQVKLADDAWNNPRNGRRAQAISDLQRLACKSLGLNREWQIAYRVDNIECPACTTFIPSKALVCPNCQTVLNPTEYTKQFKKVEQIANSK